MNIEKTLQEFDKNFSDLNAVRVEPDGHSITMDLKNFFRQALEEQQQQLIEKLPKENGDNDAYSNGWNDCVKYINEIINQDA